MLTKTSRILSKWDHCKWHSRLLLSLILSLIKPSLLCHYFNILAIAKYYWFIINKWMNDEIMRWKAKLGWGQPGLLRWFGMKHVPGAGLIVKPANLQSSAPPLCKGYPLWFIIYILIYWCCSLILEVCLWQKFPA